MKASIYDLQNYHVLFLFTAYTASQTFLELESYYKLSSVLPIYKSLLNYKNAKSLIRASHSNIVPRCNKAQAVSNKVASKNKVFIAPTTLIHMYQYTHLAVSLHSL